MALTELLVIAIGLSMDAFAVSICKGLSVSKVKVRHALCIGLYFGGFQALMPLIGYFFGSVFDVYIRSFDHWVAFVLLAIIGGNMIRESFEKEEKELNDSFSVSTMIPLAIATSIDALATGITFAVLPGVDIRAAVALIGAVTFLLSAAGLKVGNLFGEKYKNSAEFFGGCVLILLGLKILLEHLGVLG